MTGSPVRLALDPGSAAAKVALAGVNGKVITSPPVDGDWRDCISGALAEAGVGLPADGVCLVVPEAWLDGSVDGTAEQEAVRHACEDGLGITGITWTGQLAAVAARAAQQRGPGRYVVCDLGADGVRTAVLQVTGPVVAIVAAHSSTGGGWRDFDAAIRATVPGGGDRLPADWYLMAAEQDRRAQTVLRQAASAPRWRQAKAYTITGPHGDQELSAGRVVDCFAPTEQQIRAGAAQVLGDRSADVAVLTGGLAWLPLAAVALADATGISPVIENPDAAARGGLLFASGAVRLAPAPALAPVTLPAHRIANGQLEEASLELPWTEPFASIADEPLVLDEPVLTVLVGGRPVTVQLAGLTPGPCQIGLRPGWAGASALVVRPVGGAGEPVVVGIDASDAPGG